MKSSTVMNEIMYKQPYRTADGVRMVSCRLWCNHIVQALEKDAMNRTHYRCIYCTAEKTYKQAQQTLQYQEHETECKRNQLDPTPYAMKQLRRRQEYAKQHHYSLVLGNQLNLMIDTKQSKHEPKQDGSF